MAKAPQEEEREGRFHTVGRNRADKTRGSTMPSARSVCASSRGTPEEERRGFESCPRATTASTAIASTLGCPSNINNNSNKIIGRRPLAPSADAAASSTTSALVVLVVLVWKKPLRSVVLIWKKLLS
jgi:hypothetical protein